MLHYRIRIKIYMFYPGIWIFAQGSETNFFLKGWIRIRNNGEKVMLMKCPVLRLSEISSVILLLD